MAQNNFLLQRLRSFGERVAIVHRDREWTYAQIVSEIERLKAAMPAEGVAPGMITAVVGDYCFESICLLLALAENRNIIVPIAASVEAVIEERIRDSAADIVVRVEGSELRWGRTNAGAAKHPLVDTVRNLGTAGLILFSSGSTGRPKIMLHDFNAYVAAFEDRKLRDERMLVFLIFDHVGGLNTLLTALSSGMAMVLCEARDAESVCRLIARHRVDILPTSPTFLNLILMSEAYRENDLSCVRIISYGTEPMPESLLHRLREIFPKARFVQLFGTSETGIARTVSKGSDSVFIKFDDPNTEIKIVNSELWLRTKTQVLGYLNTSMENFSDDGWYKTGDLVETSEDGYLKIVGRAKAMINVGGRKVIPEHVESVILQMPEVRDCMVFGEKNAITGEAVVVEVVPTDASVDAAAMKKAIRTYCKDLLEPYKLPTKVTLVAQTAHSDRFKKVRVRPDA